MVLSRVGSLTLSNLPSCKPVSSCVVEQLQLDAETLFIFSVGASEIQHWTSNK